MASLSNKIVIENRVRPCIVIKKRALFHRWEDRDELNLKGQLQHLVVGIIEYEDGTVDEAYPREIRFVDNWVSTIHDNL